MQRIKFSPFLWNSHATCLFRDPKPRCQALSHLFYNNNEIERYSKISCESVESYFILPFLFLIRPSSSVSSFRTRRTFPSSTLSSRTRKFGSFDSRTSTRPAKPRSETRSPSAALPSASTLSITSGSNRWKSCSVFKKFLRRHHGRYLSTLV